MKKVFCIICASIAAGVALMNFSSCEKYILPELVLAADTLYVADTMQVVPVGVKSNVKWTVSMDDQDSSWISVTPKAQVKGDSTIYITIEANTEAEPRETSLTVTSETLLKSIYVHQDEVR